MNIEAINQQYNLIIDLKKKTISKPVCQLYPAYIHRDIIRDKYLIAYIYLGKKEYLIGPDKIYYRNSRHQHRKINR